MRAFAALYRRLDAATSARHKQSAIAEYLHEARAHGGAALESAAWAVYFLAGGKPRQVVNSRLLRRLGLGLSGLPEWLFEECYESVGDLAETLSLVLPPPAADEHCTLEEWMTVRFPTLAATPEAARLDALTGWARRVPVEERLVFFKLITGSLRVGVSRQTVVLVMASVAGVDTAVMAQRMMGYARSGSTASAAALQALLGAADDAVERGPQPYPFYLAHSLADLPEERLGELLGDPRDWLVEWKFDGIRAQWMRRGTAWYVWTRGKELANEQFPELAALAAVLPDGTVLDGELVVLERAGDPALGAAFGAGRIAPFSELQRRLGRKTPTAKVIDALPVAFVAYDVLEWQRADLRSRPQHERRALLEEIVAAARAAAGAAADGGLALRLSPRVEAADWGALNRLRHAARERGLEGLMLKSRASSYGTGRHRSPVGAHWWKWKLDPLSIDAVLIYARRGHGRRSGVYSDYTFALWDADCAPRELVPVAKAYSGLTDAEMREVDAIIRRTTLEAFGPVRRVDPQLVFELGFEGVAASTRHRSGVAVRFPRMLRWRRDKKADDADTLARLRELIPDQLDAVALP